MSYDLKFLPTALKEWEKLGDCIRIQLKKKLAQRLLNPVVPADRLHGFPNHYKIKLRSSGHRLVYEVVGTEITVYVIAIGKRNDAAVYKALTRIRTKRFVGALPSSVTEILSKVASILVTSVVTDGFTAHATRSSLSCTS